MAASKEKTAITRDDHVRHITAEPSAASSAKSRLLRFRAAWLRKMLITTPYTDHARLGAENLLRPQMSPSRQLTTS